MSFQPYDRNPSGIVFFGTDSTDQVFESNANFTIDGTSLLATNLKISNGGNIGSVSDPDAISIASGGDVTISQDLIVTGDFTVNGTTTTVNTTNTVVTDSLIELSNGTTSAANDAGFIVERGATGDNAVFVWDESADKFTMGTTTATGASTGNLTITTGTLVANLEGDVTGDVSGNAGTATALETSRNFSLTGEVTASAIGFDGTGNVALSAALANSAITGQTELSAAPDATNDYILIYDASASELKKINRSNFVSGLGAMSNFTLTADSGSNQTIGDGETLDIAGGDGITTAVGATDTVTVTVDLKANGGLVIETGEIAVDLGASAITGTLAIGDGGTGATTASGARTALGLAIGSDVQAYDAGLASIAGLTTGADKMIYTTALDTYAVTTLSSFGRSLIDDADASAARTTLGVDQAGTDNSTDVSLNAAVTDVLSINGSQEVSAVDNGSDAVVGWDDSAGTLTYLSAADARAALNVDVAGTDNSTQVTLAGSLDYLTISGQTITRNAIVLTTDVSGQLPVTNGGTGATSASGARTNLGLAIGSDVQAYHANLGAIAGMTPADGYFIVGNGSTFVLENGATARASLNVDVAGTDNSTPVTLVTTSHDYLSLSGQAITLGTIDISDDTNLAAGTGLTLSGDTMSISTGGVDTNQLAGDAVTGAKIADDAVDSEHLVDGSVDEVHRNRTVATVSSTSTLSSDINLCSGGASGITVTLPSVSGASGKIVVIKKVDSAAGAVTIDAGSGSESLDGGENKILYHQYETMTCVCDGSNWFVI